MLFSLVLAVSGIAPRPKSFRNNLDEASSEISSSNYLKAARLIGNAVQQQPWKTDLWEAAAYYALLGDDPWEAIEYLQQSFPISESTSPNLPQNVSLQALAILAQAYEQIGEFDEALFYWQEAEQEYGCTSELLEHRAKIYLLQGDFSSAIIDLKQLAHLEPENWWVVYQLGLLQATQDPEEALVYLEKASELNPRGKSNNNKIINSIKSSRYTDDPALTLLSVGRALASINEWELACEAFRQALIRDPAYAEAWAFLGEALQHLDNRPTTDQQSRDGLQEIQTAIALNPDSLSAHLFLSSYWTRLGRYEPALDAMQKAIKLDPNNPLLYTELAKIQAISGDNENAHQSYLQAIVLAPEDPSFIRGLIEFSIAYDYQVNEVALPAARRLLINFQSDATNYDLFAQVMIKLGDLANAERFLKRALAIDPELGVVHLHLGLVYILQSEDEKAFHELNLALSLSPDPYDPVADQAQRLLHNHFAQ